MQQFRMRSVRGAYKFGNRDISTYIQLDYKPKWFHRMMMKFFFGLHWVDETTNK